MTTNTPNTDDAMAEFCESLEIENVRLREGVSREMDEAVNSAVLGNDLSHLREMQRLRDRICNVLSNVRNELSTPALI